MKVSHRKGASAAGTLHQLITFLRMTREGSMPRCVLPAASVLAAFLAIPALASPCGDGIRMLEARVDDAASRTAALSGGGQGVAASRQAQAQQAEAQGQSTNSAVQKLPEHDVAATSAVTPLAGGDKALKAKAALERARVLDREGRATDCAAALEEARRELGATQ
jgi:hypothetical protein